MTIQELQQLLEESKKAIKTPFGMGMEALGLDREKVKGYLENAYFSVGPQRDPNALSLQKPIANTIAQALPYETTPGQAALQISPVYHGSPYRFNKFKNEAIGTGEGVQAFGYGHYVSEAPEVGKNYMNPKGMYLVDGKEMSATEAYNKISNEVGWDYLDGVSRPGRVVNQLLDDLKSGKPTNPYPEGSQRFNLYESIKDRFSEQKGYLYEAALHKGKKPGEYKYLPWDIVPEEIFKDISLAIEKEFPNTELLSAIKAYGKYGEGHRLGANVYNTLSDYLGGQKQASAFLQRSGISGIKYPAGSLSGVKSDKFNYVVFDPEDIAIEGVK